MLTEQGSRSVAGYPCPRRLDYLVGYGAREVWFRLLLAKPSTFQSHEGSARHEEDPGFWRSEGHSVRVLPMSVLDPSLAENVRAKGGMGERMTEQAGSHGMYQP